MKIKTDNLNLKQLDFAAAKADGHDFATLRPYLSYTEEAEACFQIMDREKISVRNEDWDKGGWWAHKLPTEHIHSMPFTSVVGWFAKASSPDIAILRCFVKSKLGDEVDIPDALCE